VSWKPDTYLQFAAPRTRPAADLLARIPTHNPRRVIDLGCGTGNSTALLAARWPGASLEGLDSSAEMLAEARAGDVAAEWIQGDIAAWKPRDAYDVIFSNAALQWLDGHDRLLPRLMSFVRPMGVFAFQVPANTGAPVASLVEEVAADPRWAAKLANVHTIHHLSAEAYYDILKPHARALDIWETRYLHVLDGEDAVYRWTSGSGLGPYLQLLSEDQRAEFSNCYKAKLEQAYPRRSDGTTLLPFRRLCVIGFKS